MKRPTKLSEARTLAKTNPDPALLHWEKGKAGAAAACVRTLSLLTPSAAVLKALASYGGDKRGGVVKELILASVGFDAVVFAQQVLAKNPAKKVDLSPLKAPDLRLIAGMSALEVLKLDTWGLDTQMAALGALPKLHTLTVDLVKVDALTGLEALGSLRTLTLNRCHNLTDFTALSALSVLETVNVNAPQKLTSVAGLSLPPSVTSLSIDVASVLNSLAGLDALPALSSLRLGSNWKLRDYRPLASLKTLDSLFIHSFDCTDITALTGLTGLTGLWLSSPLLEDFAPLSTLTQLKSLSLNGCKRLRSLAPLHTMTALEDLRIQLCPQLTDLDVLEHLPSLSTVSNYTNKDHPVFSRRPDITVTP
ncbi:MAG: hypothetical protein ACI8RZ_002212 [Myxococcota bacterium]|jgi:hypothetical protein